ncbi:hypothetical protein LEP1GSC016_2792 [Leptospira borgpetersenii serovar Hardjo-bovis str. Sponselee]|uniref:Uncharacterized protein n=1 Tax=Leptospira borgpetersenii serovar Hardjo-bovis str. Sponselee TaxID=1303729 RepID=M6BSI8_LEPBO|nr:hypothetical protein LEP1GSC016_2792 [Leptospira borgpetersenii serovar Hardjo-bovis str. Sponselee]
MYLLNQFSKGRLSSVEAPSFWFGGAESVSSISEAGVNL